MSESKQDHKIPKLPSLYARALISGTGESAVWSRRVVGVTRLRLDTLVADNIGIAWHDKSRPDLTVECPPCYEMVPARACRNHAVSWVRLTMEFFRRLISFPLGTVWLCSASTLIVKHPLTNLQSLRPCFNVGRVKITRRGWGSKNFSSYCTDI